jgi:hypothetical protein
MPATAVDIGTTTEEILKMSPAEQLEVYQRYLRKYNYRGGPLAMMQAAPSKYRRLIDRYNSWSLVPKNEEVYARTSDAWALNSAWRGPDDRITVGSIEAYYARQG